MAKVFKLDDYRKKVLEEPFPAFSDEEITEFLNEGVEKAIEMMADRAAKKVNYEILKKILG